MRVVQLVFLLSLMAFSACTADQVPEPLVSDCPPVVPRYAEVAAIFQQRCATSGCHNGTVFPDLRSYETALPSLRSGRLHQEVVLRRTMPPGPALDSAQIKMISCWHEANYPE